MAKIDAETKKELKKMAEEITNELTPVIKEIYTNAVEEFHLELSKAFDEIIRQFYTYKTTSYYRHNEGIGTGKGKNLYESFLSEVEYKGEYADHYLVRVVPDFMESKNYKTTADQVLDMVLNGYRSPLGKVGEKTKLHNHNKKKYYQAQKIFLNKNNEFRAKIEFNGQEMEGTPLEILTRITNVADVFVMSRCNKILDSEFKNIQKLL